MTRLEDLRAAISTALCDPNFMAHAARTTGEPLRELLNQRLDNANVGVIVVAAISSGNEPPYRAVELVWRTPPDGELQHQTVKWTLAPWAFAAERVAGYPYH